MNESTNYLYAKEKFLELLTITDEKEDREAMANKFAMIVGLSLLQELLHKLPADVSTSVMEALKNKVSDEFVDELKAYFTEVELHDMHRQELRLNMQKYVDAIAEDLDTNQIEQIQTLMESIE